MCDIAYYCLYGCLGLVGLIALLTAVFGSFFTVKQQSTAVVERFGKFKTLANPGLNLKVPLVDKIVKNVSLRIQQLDVKVETKTKDNVFVDTKVSVQFNVLPDKVKDAYYKLSDAKAQIESYIFDLVRAEIPKLSLDEVFEKKDDIANAVKRELGEAMDDFGYNIVKALVTDIDPDKKVKESMNSINAAQRERMAAQEKGEAEKILKVKQAEAEAASKELQGKGIAKQRKAIVDGLKESVIEFQEGVPGSTAQDVMSLVLITQYFDMLKDLGNASKTNTVFLNHSPAALDQLQNTIVESLLSTKSHEEKEAKQTVKE